ncbi:MAG: hypothetical protein M9945_06055 [Aquamicrobium sp.]|uniref:hypothetical protein n=1 Tax=Aquamicrobium sp. TaxID=1872579 RepID=UPI00349E8FDB|nr:hypothetical protein [Aquamicrobium sp.]
MAILSNSYAAGKRRGDAADGRQSDATAGGQADLGDGRHRVACPCGKPETGNGDLDRNVITL